ncbi:MAG: M67 family metallopeptidase [Chlorobiales bacterium]|nr:M67 family metallopeptidase [Chlorobiales bacterium]
MLIPARKLEIIHNHALRTFPEECCGLLAGRIEQSHEGHYENTVYEVAPCQNVLSWNRQEGFEISTYEYRDIENEARNLGYQIIGAYHSHTNADAVPSNHDLEHAPQNHSVLIVSVRHQSILQTRSWVRGGRASFNEERIFVPRLSIRY